jgi:hypothetical protein
MYSRFGEAICLKYGHFNGTRFTLNDNITSPDGIILFSKGTRLNVARNPDDFHSKYLLNLLDEAKKFDESIQFSIPFCIQFSNHCNCGSKACLPLFDQSIAEKFPVPQEVLDFFKFLKVEPLCNNLESLGLKLERLCLENEKLKESLSSLTKEYNEISAEVLELQPDLDNIVSMFNEADKSFTFLRNLLEANREVTEFFGELVVFKQEFFLLFEKSSAKRKVYLDQMTALTIHFSSREKIALQQKQAIILHEKKLEEQVNAEKQAKIAFFEAKKQLLSKLTQLGPVKIPARFSRFLEDNSAFGGSSADAFGSEVDASSN